ncbi:hypothetical protein K450DRAFT_261473 [Umbelopsis ramanniana AG]|uniref:MRH domain-containing protein n=1 Tax=Umbelopsis ramanniana AG TaxID=1314678 RepID=A0AAD5E0Z1_UMBRA|nr:uncharacterized protein K450DRAFT_261473 [Umbelopsis ramanniana AG]KAI8575496.1 hypothetical protein K450DRAFT_261473 [Umbelopsis ramanniana AG]
MRTIAWISSFIAVACSVLAQDLDPCQTRDSKGNLYDLSPLKKSQGEMDWTFYDPDSSLEYRLNICDELQDKSTGLMRPERVGAFTKEKSESKGYNIGEYSNTPFIRGDKLMIEYTNGQQCPRDGDVRRSTLVSFICDRGVTDMGTPILIAQPRDCYYWFEWRTPAACPVRQATQSGGVWTTIWTIIWVGVFGYLIGGILYNRFAKKATGMQQIPHYDFWYLVYDWVKDMTLILGGYIFGFLQSARSRTSLRGNSSSNQQYHGLGNDEEHAFIDDDDEE